MRAYYRRHVTYQEQKLDALKKSRKQKIEELKQKANYYTAKNLIDRYASDDENPSELDQSPRQRQRSNIENNFAGEHGHESPKQIVDANYAINYSLSNPAPQNLNTTFPLQNQIARTWVDRVLDLIVGEESPGTRFALICENCFNHNGLALPEELDSLQYVCPKCSHLNVKKKSLPNSKNSDENSTVKQRIKTTEKQEQKESIE